MKCGPYTERFFFFIRGEPVALTQAVPSEPFVYAETLKACALISPHLLTAEDEAGSSGCQSLDLEDMRDTVAQVRTQRGKFCSVWYGARPVR